MKKITFKPGYILFFMGLLLLECSNFLVNVSFLSLYLRIIKLISLIILACSALIINIKSNNITLKKCIFLCFIFLISIISFYVTKTTLFLEFFLVSFNVLKMEFDKAVKADMIIKIFIIFFVTLMNKLGYANSDFVVTRDGSFIREAYGFYHPNTFGMILMMTFFDYMYIIRNKIDYKKYIIAIALIIFIKLTSDTRTAIYCIVLYMLLISIKKYLLFDGRIVNLLKNNLYIILLFMSIILTICYIKNYEFAIQLNQFLSNRLSLQGFYFNIYNINLIGNNIDFIKTLDNGYVKVILNYGLITTAFLAVLYNLNLKRATKEKNKELIFILLILMIFTLSESSMLYIYNNIFVIYCLSKIEVINNEE